jgi:replication-associated recombination protein RarA
MTFNELKTALPILMKHNITPFIWGAQGIGKTSIIKQLAKENDLGFVHLHLATQEVGDLVGLLIPEGNGKVTHAKPAWFPTSGKGIIFLDEFNRATNDVLNACFSLMTEKTIHTHKLPDGWHVVAAGNYQTNAFNVTDTSDAALMSRFCHIDFNPSKEEFVMFAEDNEAFTVASFIRTHGELLEVEHKEKLNMSTITPDRRAWLNMIAPLETEESIENMRYSLYAGIVGPTAAASFLTHKKKQHDRLSGVEILKNFSKMRSKIEKLSDTKNTRFDLLNSASDEIFLIINKGPLTEKQLKNFQEFILTVPLELNYKIINKISETQWSQKNEILNNKKFVDLFKKSKLGN